MFLICWSPSESWSCVWSQLIVNLRWLSLGIILFLALHSFQHFKTHVFSWSRKVLAPVDEPLKCAYEEDDSKGDNAVI